MSMTTICARFWGTALLGGVLSACGGSATRSGPEGEAAAGSGTTTTTTGGSGTTTTGGAPATPQWLTELKLDDVFPWFVQRAGGSYETAPANGPDGVVYIKLEGAPVEATISTHNHLDVVHVAHAATFRAKANTALTLLVSVKEGLDADYFTARDTGKSWPVAPVNLDTEWSWFTVPFSDMVPRDEAVEQAPPAFTIAFVVDSAAGPVELWLDDVHFE